MWIALRPAEIGHVNGGPQAAVQISWFCPFPTTGILNNLLVLEKYKWNVEYKTKVEVNLVPPLLSSFFLRNEIIRSHLDGILKLESPCCGLQKNL